MKVHLLLGAGKGVRLSVLEMVAKSPSGLGAAEMSNSLGMSYMGVKSHCLALTDEGYLLSRREPSSKGRPRLLYRLAKAGEALFAGPSRSLALGLLGQAASVHGKPFAEKLLLLHCREEARRYRKTIRGTTPGERAVSFAALRDGEGWMARYRETEEGTLIEEFRDPESDVLAAYPILAKLREQMVSEILGCPVSYSQEGAVSRYRF